MLDNTWSYNNITISLWGTDWRMLVNNEDIKKLFDLHFEEWLSYKVPMLPVPNGLGHPKEFPYESHKFTLPKEFNDLTNFNYLGFDFYGW